MTDMLQKLGSTSAALVVTLGSLCTAELARAQSCHWEAVGGASLYDLGRIYCLAAYDDGNGGALYVGGTFRESLGGPGSRIAKWDGGQWSPLGSGIGNVVYTLEVHDDGSGLALYAGGVFRRAGEVDGNSIARWDGKEWSALGSGMYNPGPFGPNHTVRDLEVFDDGSGPALYAGGKFIEAGGVPALSIARWDGESWSSVGEGLVLTGFDAEVTGLGVYDDGDGPALYAGGSIDGSMHRWDGRSWQVVPNVAGPAEAIIAFDDGSGRMLYVGGQLGLGPALHVGRWDGAAWSALGAGVDYRVHSLYRFDDGTGAGLYVGGTFSQAGPVSTWGIARWDGAWSALGSGLYNAPFGPSADAMTVFDDGSGPALYVAGVFTAAGGVPANSIARWKCDTCYADCDRSGALDVFDFLCFQDAFVASDQYADCDGNGSFDIFDFLCFQDAFVAGCQ